jgi:hypothetical protein
MSNMARLVFEQLKCHEKNVFKTDIYHHFRRGNSKKSEDGNNMLLLVGLFFLCDHVTKISLIECFIFGSTFHFVKEKEKFEEKSFLRNYCDIVGTLPYYSTLHCPLSESGAFKY